MNFDQTQDWKIAYDQKINEINIERDDIQTFYILVSCIIMHFHGMYDLLGLSFSWHSLPFPRDVVSPLHLK